jgi:hypothetical protein
MLRLISRNLFVATALRRLVFVIVAAVLGGTPMIAVAETVTDTGIRGINGGYGAAGDPGEVGGDGTDGTSASAIANDGAINTATAEGGGGGRGGDGGRGVDGPDAGTYADGGVGGDGGYGGDATAAATSTSADNNSATAAATAEAGYLGGRGRGGLNSTNTRFADYGITGQSGDATATAIADNTGSSNSTVTSASADAEGRLANANANANSLSGIADATANALNNSSVANPLLPAADATAVATGDRGATATVQSIANGYLNYAVASGTATTRLNDAVSDVTADGLNAEAHSSATSAGGITASTAVAGDYPGVGMESTYATSSADGSAASGLVTSEATATGGTAVADAVAAGNDFTFSGSSTTAQKSWATARGTDGGDATANATGTIQGFDSRMDVQAVAIGSDGVNGVNGQDGGQATASASLLSGFANSAITVEQTGGDGGNATTGTGGDGADSHLINAVTLSPTQNAVAGESVSIDLNAGSGFGGGSDAGLYGKVGAASVVQSINRTDELDIELNADAGTRSGIYGGGSGNGGGGGSHGGGGAAAIDLNVVTAGNVAISASVRGAYTAATGDDISLSAWGESTGGGDVAVTGSMRGGSAADSEYGSGIDAADISAVNLVDGATSGSLRLNQSVSAGTGGWDTTTTSGRGGNGGDAYSELGKTGNQESISVSASASGGSGGRAEWGGDSDDYSTGYAGDGRAGNGAAVSQAINTGGEAIAGASATGGKIDTSPELRTPYGYYVNEDRTRYGEASATATADARNGGTNASARATAQSTKVVADPFTDQPAYAEANAYGDNGDVSATAQVNGTGTSVARAAGKGVGHTVTAEATNKQKQLVTGAGGTMSARATVSDGRVQAATAGADITTNNNRHDRYNAGAVASGQVAIGNMAGEQSSLNSLIALPDQAVVDNFIAGNGNAESIFGDPGSVNENIMLGGLFSETAYGYSASNGYVSGNNFIEMALEMDKLEVQKLYVGLFDGDAQQYGDYGWDALTFLLTVEGAELARETFSSTAEAELYFADNLLMFNNIGISGDGVLDVRLEFLTADGESAGMYGNFAVATAVPIPAAVWMFGSGLLGLFGFAKRRAR